MTNYSSIDFDLPLEELIGRTAYLEEPIDLRNWNPQLSTIYARRKMYLDANTHLGVSLRHARDIWNVENGEKTIFIPYLRIAGHYDQIIKYFRDSQADNRDVYSDPQLFVGKIMSNHGYYAPKLFEKGNRYFNQHIERQYNIELANS